MQGIVEKMPNLESAPEQEYSAASYEGDSSDIVIEASVQFSDGFELNSEFTSSEFPADEDAADALDDAWSEIELKYFMAQKDNNDDGQTESTPEDGQDADSQAEMETEAEAEFGEISYEAMKAIWMGDESPLPQKNAAPKDVAKEKPKEAPREILAERCPKCGTTWDRLREDGRAGCAKCYVAFHDRLVDVMNRMQREAQHVGKTPRAAVKRRRRLEHLRARRDHRLEMLNRRLQEAITAEKYEDAAQLRDKIKMVSSTIVSDQL
jgi:protein-arginine kinase activator protein McsA